ncbi:phasin family protein [Bifidobacterium sp. UBA744]|uniref:phasin family protein n=1 Tax=Bifidobacterium sp. UBA744 TaxID=1946112 RepID=UPI0025C702AF|nr:phasin family protein [Bifidobacterium sp. UBA744]
MADLKFGEGLRKVFLAGVGALATGYEKGSELVDELVKKGELTVEQGKTLNEELKRTVKEATARKPGEPDEPIDTTVAGGPADTEAKSEA